MNDTAHILTPDALTVFVNGRIDTVHKTDPRYTTALELLRAEDYDSLAELLKPAEKLQTFLHSTSDNVRLVDDTIYYHDQPLHNHVTARALTFAQQGLNPRPLLNFIERVMQNPSSRAVNELFGFLERGQLPITPDGCFLAFKKVRSDYKDVHSGKNDNSIGQVVSLPRNAVDDNPNNTCSHGLHFASRDYLSCFPGDHLMVLKIDPADVVSIPVDYNNSKGRCCRYEVVGELEMTPEEHNPWGVEVVDEYEEETDEEFDEEIDEFDREPHLNAMGYRFTKTGPFWDWALYDDDTYVTQAELLFGSLLDAVDDAWCHHQHA
jgi:hypothetical protein